MEEQLGIQIRKSAKKDKDDWLQGLIANGSWNEVKKLRRVGKVIVLDRTGKFSWAAR